MMTVNLKDGMPPAKVAVHRMFSALALAHKTHISAVKLIHGYGSTGKGGKIRGAVRRELREMKAAGKIREFVPGVKMRLCPRLPCSSPPSPSGVAEGIAAVVKSL
ncbi:MAG: hypothetical protein HFG19_05030, partial [Oscillospiraceae bacterium]|nr:hypothetical protein [Oscillospiraceae bacterium]